tara:strand:+ start:461 stop:724 length:264 start_codon:yes stop_codon:yes gene_type:complete
MPQQWKYREHIDKQGKFRVGDLVRLSAYGKSTEQNTNHHFDGDEIGLIKKISYSSTDKYPIEVQWVNRPNKNIATRFFFRELKLIRS